MSRTVVPFTINDLSSFARALRTELTTSTEAPTHVELLNMLARAAGHRNYQALRAQAAAQHQLTKPVEPPPVIDYVRVRRVALYFDHVARMKHWPNKETLQEPCLWALWSVLPARGTLAEAELNAILKANHLFGDHVLLRRELCDRGLVERTADGREYRRVERRPPPDAAELIHILAQRRPQ